MPYLIVGVGLGGYAMPLTYRNGQYYEVSDGDTWITANKYSIAQPVNLYFPDAWMEQAQRDLEYAMYQTGQTNEEIPNSQRGYLVGIAEVDPDAYNWIAILCYINLENLPLRVPAWVYTHQRDPNKHDYRVFDGTEGE